MKSQHKLVLKLTPTSIWDIEARQIPIGLEYCFDHNKSIYLQIGIPLLDNIPHPRYNNKQKLDISTDLKFKFEYRDYIKDARSSSYFICAEMFERTMKINRENNGYTMVSGVDDIHVYFTKAKLNRTEFGLGASFGGVHRLANKFFAEWFIGIDLRIAEGNYYDVENYKVTSVGHHYFDLDGDSYNVLKYGSSLWFYLPLG